MAHHSRNASVDTHLLLRGDEGCQVGAQQEIGGLARRLLDEAVHRHGDHIGDGLRDLGAWLTPVGKASGALP